MYQVVVSGNNAPQPQLVVGEPTTSVQRAYQSALRILALLPDGAGDIEEFKCRFPISAFAIHLHSRTLDADVCTCCGRVRSFLDVS